MRQLKNHEIATVLGALRHFQSVCEHLPEHLPEHVADHFVDFHPLDAAEIDSLCEELNGDDTWILTADESARLA